MPLTAIQCSSAKPKEKPYRLADSGGMYMEVMPNGSKYWRLKYRLLGKEKRLALGVYPAVSLAEARESRDIAKKMIKAGEDPCFAKKEGRRKKVLNAENTFKAVATEWHKAHLARWSENYGKEIIHRLEQDVFPHIGNRPIADISPMELLEVIKKIEKRGALEAARRTLQLCGQVFKYAIPHGLAERNPALRPCIGQREVFYSLKTKSLTEAKVRSWSVLNAVQKAFKYALAGNIVSNQHLQEHLSQLGGIILSLNSVISAWNHSKSHLHSK